jgi:hypothetical protein
MPNQIAASILMSILFEAHLVATHTIEFCERPVIPDFTADIR